LALYGGSRRALLSALYCIALLALRGMARVKAPALFAQNISLLNTMSAIRIAIVRHGLFY